MLKELLKCMNKVIISTLLKLLAQYIKTDLRGKVFFFAFLFFFILIVLQIPNNTVLLTGQRHDRVQTESEAQPWTTKVVRERKRKCCWCT